MTIQEEFKVAEISYYEGRESIKNAPPSYPDLEEIPKPPKADEEELKSEFAMDSDGNIVKEEVEPKKASNEDKKRAASLLHEFLQSTIQVTEKGRLSPKLTNSSHLLKYHQLIINYVIGAAIIGFGAGKIEEKIDTNPDAKKYKDATKKVAKAGADLTNKALNYAVDGCKSAYKYAQTDEFKSGWKKTMDSTKSAAKSVGGYISTFLSSGSNTEANQNEPNRDEYHPVSGVDTASVVQGQPKK